MSLRVSAAALMVIAVTLGPSGVGARVLGGIELPFGAPGGPLGGADVARAPSGDLVVVWGQNFQRFDALGTPLGPATPFTIGGGNPDVSTDGAGNFVVAWGDSDGNDIGVFARRFDSAGTALGPAFQVNTFTTGRQYLPSVGVRSSGEFVIVWSGGSLGPGPLGVFARRFDASGVAAGVEFQVNTFTTGNQLRADVTVNGAGDMLVVWQSEPTGPHVAQDGDGAGVFGRRFDSTGTPAGVEFQVNSFTTGEQYLPAVSGDAAGNAVVVWISESQDGDGRGVYGQRYDAAGLPQGAEFQVNGYTTGAQVLPAVSHHPAGGFVVTWNGDPPVFAEGGVFAKRFDAAGLPLGGDFRVHVSKALTHFGQAISAWTGEEFFVVWNRLSGSSGSPGPNELLGRRFAPVAGVSARSLSLADPGDPTRRRVTVRSTDAALSTGAAGVNPVADGAHLHVYNTAGTGDSACLPLPASGWEARGNPNEPSFTYEDRAHVHGPCHTATVRGNVPNSSMAALRATCKANVQPIPYSLDEAQQGSVAVRFVSGGAAYCLAFGGQVVTDRPGRFVARKPAAPVVCPPPPVACP